MGENHAYRKDDRPVFYATLDENLRTSRRIVNVVIDNWMSVREVEDAKFEAVLEDAHGHHEMLLSVEWNPGCHSWVPDYDYTEDCFDEYQHYSACVC